MDLSKARTVTTELWECKSKLQVGIVFLAPPLTVSVLESLAGLGTEERSDSSSAAVTAKVNRRTQF